MTRAFIFHFILAYESFENTRQRHREQGRDDVRQKIRGEQVEELRKPHRRHHTGQRGKAHSWI